MNSFLWPACGSVFSNSIKKTYTAGVISIDGMSVLGLNEAALLEEFSRRYGKGLFHCRGAMHHLYTTGTLAGLEETAQFRDNRPLAQKVIGDFAFDLPPVSRVLEEDDTVKFTLVLNDGQRVESVIIPMRNHTSLCVSSQVGCARGCVFCRTGQMGLIRNLSAAEIIAQYMTARFVFGQDIRNIVFMGMGEPLDNLDAVLAAVDILTDCHGAAIFPRRISISTCGQCQGLECLKDRIAKDPGKGYQLLPLSVSLHSVNDSVRDSLMPVNRIWPLERLRHTLLSMPHARDKDKIFFEYIVIPSVNDSPADAAALKVFMEGFRAKVNLIAFQAQAGSSLSSATWDDVDRFWSYLRGFGITCFSRISKGQGIQASCGQLATETNA